MIGKVCYEKERETRSKALALRDCGDIGFLILRLYAREFLLTEGARGHMIGQRSVKVNLHTFFFVFESNILSFKFEIRKLEIPIYNFRRVPH